MIISIELRASRLFLYSEVESVLRLLRAWIMVRNENERVWNELG